MGRCVAPGCTSNNVGCLENVDLSFHRFPTDTDRRREWSLAVKGSNWLPSNHSVICSRHFRPDDFSPVIEDSQRPRLRMSAVPSLFIPLDNGRKILGSIPKVSSRNCPSTLYSIRKDHSYNLEQPEVLKRKLDQAVSQLERYKYKLKTSRVISQMRKQKCIELKKLLSKFKKEEKVRKSLPKTDRGARKI